MSGDNPLMDRNTSWVSVPPRILAGNRDTSSSVSRELEGAIVARRLRIVPISNQTRTVCLRFELYGCKYRDIVSSYSAPVASSADGLSLIDFSYDGKQKDGVNIGGLGKLTDGFEGHDNFEKFPQKWVGWRKQKNGAEFITVRFDFNDRRNISAILLHTSTFNPISGNSNSTACLSPSTPFGSLAGVSEVVGSPRCLLHSICSQQNQFVPPANNRRTPEY